MNKVDNVAAAETVAAELDPLLCDMEMPLRAEFHPLGFTVDLITNSSAVIAAAEESWAHVPKKFFEPAVQLRIGVRPGQDGSFPPAPRTYRAWQNLLTTIADADNFAVSDMRQGISFAWVTPAVAADRAFFRYHFLENAALSLLNNRYMTPLHAACVRRADRGVLLCGDSGAGKSSLSYACAKRGWTFIADDACCLIRGRKNREVVGNPYQIRFREAGTKLFPELEREQATLRGNGEFSIELPTARMKGISTALTSEVNFVVFLNRRDPGPPGLGPFPREAALSWFGQVVCYGEDHVRREQRDSLQHLMNVEILELRYRDLDWAVERLDALVHQGR